MGNKENYFPAKKRLHVGLHVKAESVQESLSATDQELRFLSSNELLARTINSWGTLTNAATAENAPAKDCKELPVSYLAFWVLNAFSTAIANVTMTKTESKGSQDAIAAFRNCHPNNNTDNRKLRLNDSASQKNSASMRLGTDSMLPYFNIIDINSLRYS